MYHGRLLRDYDFPQFGGKIGACANSGYQALLSTSAKLEPGDEAKSVPPPPPPPPKKKKKENPHHYQIYAMCLFSLKCLKFHLVSSGPSICIILRHAHCILCSNTHLTLRIHIVHTIAISPSKQKNPVSIPAGVFNS